jgi:glycosyltransferase involved in cell wall biosynthesis
MPQKPIRVLQVGMSDNYGGTEATIYGIYNQLDHSKIQFDFLNVYGHPIAKQKELEAHGAHVYDLLLKRREGYRKYIKGIKNFYREHAKEFDAVQCNIQCLDQIDMVRFAKKYGIKKTIVYAHNAGHGIRPSKMAKLAIWWNKKRCHHYVDCFVGCSGLAAQFAFSKRDAAKAIIINTGIDTKNFQFSPEKRMAFRKQYGFGSTTKVYGSAGRFDPQKNQGFLVAIFSQIALKDPEARFFISGRGPLEATLREKIHNAGLDSRCIVATDFIDYQGFYSGIDAFILPSIFEGLGLVLIEAQCAGLPCFVTAKTIPQEACLLPSFKYISLDEKPSTWAQDIMNETQKPIDRAEGFKIVNKEKRDNQDSARAYEMLFN